MQKLTREKERWLEREVARFDHWELPAGFERILYSPWMKKVLIILTVLAVAALLGGCEPELHSQLSAGLDNGTVS